MENVNVMQLAFAIDAALFRISIGQVEEARIKLEEVMRFACEYHEGIAEHVGLDNVRDSVRTADAIAS